MTSPQRRADLLRALRRGTVPSNALGTLAVGLEPFQPTLHQELEAVAQGAGIFKAVRGEYGCGKTFFARWLQEQARLQGFATAEVQISEADTPLHRLETVYRRLVERLTTETQAGGAFRPLIDGWFFALEEDVLADGTVAEDDAEGLLHACDALMEQRLHDITRHAPAFAAALRGYRAALARGDGPAAEGLTAWLGAQPNVAAALKRGAGIKGDVDHYGALGFLRGLLTILRDSGRPGLVLVLDEVETLQRVRTDVRDKGLNALRQWVDEVDAGWFPGLYLLITGTGAFFDGPQGVQRLPPLAGRLATDFSADSRFDNPRAVQLRLHPFDLPRLEAVGRKVRDLYAQDAQAPDRVRRLADDAYVARLAAAVTGNLGGKVGLAPRHFLKTLVGDVLDRIDQFPDFDPTVHYAPTSAPPPRAGGPLSDPDAVDLDL